MYLNGRGVDTDRVQAYAWYTLAADNGIFLTKNIEHVRLRMAEKSCFEQRYIWAALILKANFSLNSEYLIEYSLFTIYHFPNEKYCTAIR